MNKEDVAFWRFIFDIAQLAFTIGIAIYVWILSKHKANATKIAVLDEQHNAELNSVKNRLTEIETTIKHQPDRTQISRIHKRLDELSETTHSVVGSMRGVTDSIAMITQALLTRSDKQ